MLRPIAISDKRAGQLRHLFDFLFDFLFLVRGFAIVAKFGAQSRPNIPAGQLADRNFPAAAEVKNGFVELLD